MNDKTESKQAKFGIASLPQTWAVVVQLVGTFGLAVFLVLYYVLFMHPKETARYDKLEKSVTELMVVVDKQQTLLSGEQADRLEELFVAAVAGDFCVGVVEGAESGLQPSQINQSLEDALMKNVNLMQGLTRRDGKSVAGMLAEKIRVSDLSAQSYQRAANWKNLAATEMLQQCGGYVAGVLGRLRYAK